MKLLLKKFQYNESDVKFSDSPSVDAFGRLRVSQVSTRIDLKQLHDNLPLFIDQVNEDIGNSYVNRAKTVSHVHSRELARTRMTCGTVGQYCIAQTKQRLNYQTGKSQEIFQTTTNFHPQKGYIKRYGYFTSNYVAPFDVFDGLFLESTEDAVFACIYRLGKVIERTNVSSKSYNTKTIDTSTVIDWKNAEISNLDFEWLGVGRVRWLLVINGAKIPFHYSNHSNISDSVYMSTPNQPLRWELRCVSTPDEVGIFDYICGTVGSEGSINEVGKTLSIHDAGVPLAITNTTLIGVLGIRLQQDKADALIEILSNSLIDTSNAVSMWQYILNPTVAGAPVWTNYANSAVQQCIAIDTTLLITGGTVLGTGHMIGKAVSANAKSNSIKLGVSINGTQDEIWLAFKKVGSGNVSLLRAIDFREQI